MDIQLGQTIVISGMTIEIIADEGERWQTRNITTGDTVYFDKSVLLRAIKLGKAEQVVE